MTVLAVEYVPISHVKPNPWNPNRQDAFIYKKELASIQTFGFVNPVLVRELPDLTLEIIDGEHRWKAAQDLSFSELPIINLGIVEDDVAKQLTIVLNETRGVAEPARLAELLRDLSSRKPVADLLAVLPFTPGQFDGYMKGSVDWEAVERKRPTLPAERWVLRSFRLPADAAGVLDEAISLAQSDDRCPDWQALERIAAEYIAGN